LIVVWGDDDNPYDANYVYDQGQLYATGTCIISYSSYETPAVAYDCVGSDQLRIHEWYSYGSECLEGYQSDYSALYYSDDTYDDLSFCCSGTNDYAVMWYNYTYGTDWKYYSCPANSVSEYQIRSSVVGVCVGDDYIDNTYYMLKSINDSALILMEYHVSDCSGQGIQIMHVNSNCNASASCSSSATYANIGYDPNQSSSSSSGSSSTTTVAGSVTSVIIFILICAACCWLCRRRRHRHRSSHGTHAMLIEQNHAHPTVTTHTTTVNVTPQYVQMPQGNVVQPQPQYVIPQNYPYGYVPPPTQQVQYNYPMSNNNVHVNPSAPFMNEHHGSMDQPEGQTTVLGGTNQ